MAESHAPFVRPVFERLPLPHDGIYLDVGCGNGYTVRWAAAAAPDGRLDETGWGQAFESADLSVTEQFRVRLPPSRASETWKATEGSLVTLGRRPG